MAKKVVKPKFTKTQFRAVRGFDFPLDEALELVKRRGGRSRLTDEERSKLRLHHIAQDQVFALHEYPNELVTAWVKRGLCVRLDDDKDGGT
jgi:hypothetical protein